MRELVLSVLLLAAPGQLASAQPAEGCAEDDPLCNLFKLDEQVKVVAATKSELSAGEAPAVVEVITRDEIRQWGYRSIAELLNHVVGFYVQDDAMLPNVAVRGVSGGLFAESGIIKVMVDGHSVAFRSTAGNWLGPELIPLSSVERVEIIRGPGSALYGADAFLGVVNIVTRSAESLSGGDLSGAITVPTFNASHPGADLDATVGLAKGHFEALAGVRLNWEDRSGLALPPTSPDPLIPTYNQGNRTASGLTQVSRVGFVKLSYHLSKVTLTLGGRLSSIDRGAEFASWTQLSHGFDSNGRLDESRVSMYGGSLDLNVRATPTQNLTIVLDSQFFGGGPTSNDRIEVNNDQFYLNRRFGYLGVDNNLELQAKLPKAITLIGGVGLIFDRETPLWAQQVLKANLGGLMAGQTLPGTPRAAIDIYNVGVYLEAVWTPLRREIVRGTRSRLLALTLTGGARYDYHSIYSNQGSGRLGAVVTYGDLSVKALYGSAFKAPSPLLLYAMPLVPDGDLIGNPNLKPQYVNTFEGEISYRPIKYLSFSTDIAYNLITNAAQFTAQGVNQIAVNLGTINALSWETKIEASYQDWLHLQVTSEYNHTTVRGRRGIGADLLGDRNTIYPQGIVRANLSGRAPKVPLRLGGQVMYVGPRTASESNAIAAGRAYHLPGYTLLDLSLSTVGVQILKGKETTLIAKMSNLLDVRGPDPGYWRFDFPLMGRTAWIQLRQEL